jgi:hypothetical protein
MPPISRLPSTMRTGAPVRTREVSSPSITDAADSAAMRRVTRPRQSVTRVPGAFG